MSYNTRNQRGVAFNGRAGGNRPASNTTTNFVSGGQRHANGEYATYIVGYKPNERPLIQMPNQQQQQQQQQQQSNSPMQQQQQVTQQHLQQQKAATQQYSQQQPLHPILKAPKVETANISATNNVSADSEMKSDMDIDDAERKKRRPWQTGGVSKLSKKERRERRNKRFGKFVRPKNAIMVLNELCGGSNALKWEEIGGKNGMFGFTVTVENKVYEGHAPSKNGAKQKACENALKGYLANIARNRQLQQQQQQTNSSMDSDDASKMDTEDSFGDDVSWCHLASFALYKLMDSWQDVSDILQPEALFQKSPSKQNQSHVPKPIKELPANAADIHPVMLLHQMRPGIVIEDVSSSGQAPNIIYTVKVNIDGIESFGQGPNKKTARKNCAQAAMEKHFGVKYPKEPVISQGQSQGLQSSA